MSLDTISTHSETLSHQQIAQQAEQLLHTMQKVQRSNEQIQSELGRRTIAEIVNSQETCFMGACVDMTLAFLMELKNQIPSEKLSIGCEVLINPNGHPAFHLFLKDNSLTPSRIVDFVRKNEVDIYQGAYQNPRLGKGIQQMGIFELTGDKIEKTDSFLMLANKMGISIPESHFQAYLQQMQKDNTAETFQNYLASSPIAVTIRDTQRQKEQAQQATSNALGEALS